MEVNIQDVEMDICSGETMQSEATVSGDDDTPQDDGFSIPLYLSSEQLETIRSLFSHYDWDFEKSMSDGAKRLKCKNIDTLPDDTSSDNIPANNGYYIPAVEGSDICPHCLSGPCITHEENRQMWWPEHAKPAHMENSKERKKLYKKFWTMCYHRGVWQHPVYKDRKERALGGDPTRKRYTWHRRDLMPQCIIKLLRGWLPNPATVPYMGHFWE